MSETKFNSPFGQFTLHRLPQVQRDLLRAWDAADENLLSVLSQQKYLESVSSVLICNDSFGALAVSLTNYHPVSWSDSWLAHQACEKNLQNNGLDKNSVEFLDSLMMPMEELELVLIKVPKTLALLEYQLLTIKPRLKANSLVIVAGMVKNLPSSVWQLLEKIIGPTETGRAQKKSRVIQARPDFSLTLPKNPYPVSWALDDSDFVLVNHANVFSRDKLDIGARFMLQHLPQTEGEGDIIDLGCGNGVLGLMAANQNPRAKVHFVDESYMAIASARINLKQLQGNADRYSFHCSDGLINFENNTADLILCNPPFHQSHSIGDAMAMDMFKQSARVLNPEADLWVVGNRHLGYHKKLKNWFNKVELAASNAKFVILRATNPK